jgi:cysteine desulfurase
MDRKTVYLDYAAHTPADEEVLRCYTELSLAFPGNPNSTHALGQVAAEKLEEIRRKTADLLQVLPEELIYTSGASEANNLAIKGLAHALRHEGRHMISTSLEHSSVGGALTSLTESGYEVDMVPIRKNGTVDTEELRALLRDDTILVAVSAVDSELGTRQNIRELAEVIKEFPHARLHVDATQAVGKTELITDLADTLTLTPHKFYGLLGTGLLVKRKGIILTPQISGGISTTMYRSGTPDVAGAGALCFALEKALSMFDERYAAAEKWNARLRASFSQMPSIHINSPDDAVPHILNLSVDGVRGEKLQRALSEQGICVSVKSACSVPGTPSKAVYAVTHDRKRALSSIRISLSHLTTEDETDLLIKALHSCLPEHA